ncbi:FHA domain-containing protein [Noviherbaspirillum sp.]|jgi:type III secretion protein D|uniref:FHA domain-containing protein n=1 Tax=Noviherbaspirillum sp. TaxID=1926288 RepID=UPI0025D11BA0|nr:FHA domain-containing protein [Noviherbaspirillum sp.]
MLELRILDGLQAGARLKLPNGQYLIGDSDDCDIVLVGHGVEAAALQLSIDGETVVAMPRQSGCGVRVNDNTAEEFRLTPGQAFHVADIWLAIDMEDSPWPSKRSWLEQSEATIVNADAPQQLPADGALQPAVENASAASVMPNTPDAAPPRVGRWLLVGCVAAIACGSALAYVMKPTSNLDPKEKPAIGKKAAKIQEAAPISAPMVVEPKPAAPATLHEQRSVSNALPELEQSLVAHNLSKQLQVADEGNGIRISGELNSEQQQILEAILVPFVKKYGDMLAINASIIPPARNLPFGITQIASGPLPHIVTDDGVRMFIGASYKGYRLAAVRDHKLMFSGERTVEIEW